MLNFFLKLWPDFNHRDLQNIIKKFKKEEEILDQYDVKQFEIQTKYITFLFSINLFNI